MRPEVAQSPRTPASPEPSTVTWSRSRREEAASQFAATALATTLERFASPPRTSTSPSSRLELTVAPASTCSAGAFPPSTRSSEALLSGSCSRSVAADPLGRRRVASPPRPMIRTGRPAASANAPSAVSRPSRMVSRAASERAAENASAGVSLATHPSVLTPTQYVAASARAAPAAISATTTNDSRLHT